MLNQNYNYGIMLATFSTVNVPIIMLLLWKAINVILVLHLWLREPFILHYEPCLFFKTLVLKFQIDLFKCKIKYAI